MGYIIPGQHHIIKESSETLSQLLLGEFKAAGYKRVHIVANAPKPDQIEGKLPAVCVYLYQLGLDYDGVQAHRGDQEILELAQPDGSILETKRDAPMWVRLDYLVSTWAQTPEDEQLLLGLAIKALIEHPVISGETLKGDSFEPEYEMPVTLSSRLDEGTLARFWGSLNQPIRPAIQAWTSVPIYPEKLEPFTRVKERGVRYKNLLDQTTEEGPGYPLGSPGGGGGGGGGGGKPAPTAGGGLSTNIKTGTGDKR